MSQDLLFKLVHYSATLLFGYTMYFEYFELPELFRKEGKAVYNTRWIFLTFWNLVVQFLYHSCCSILGPKRLKLLQDSIFIAWVIPLSNFVSLTFWPLYHWDPVSIMGNLYKVIPSYHNHFLHTAQVLYSYVEYFLLEKQFPTKIVGSLIVAAGSGGYLFGIIVLRPGAWPYPFLDDMPGPLRVIFLSAAFLMMQTFYFIGNALHDKYGVKGTSEKRKIKTK